MKTTIADIEVPKGMLEAAVAAYPNCATDMTRSRVAAALLWLAENPIVPSDEEYEALGKAWNGRSGYAEEFIPWIATEWQRRMFLRKPDPVPDALRNYLTTDWDGKVVDSPCNNAIIAAYKLGLAAQEGK